MFLLQEFLFNSNFRKSVKTYEKSVRSLGLTHAIDILPCSRLKPLEECFPWYPLWFRGNLSSWWRLCNSSNIPANSGHYSGMSAQWGVVVVVCGVRCVVVCCVVRRLPAIRVAGASGGCARRVHGATEALHARNVSTCGSLTAEQSGRAAIHLGRGHIGHHD